ncbi:MAG: GNAT family N-acetyltransferase [Thermoleophilia bacterium]|nr:GNAT family N-acetyltransferase [Thermoleophilia bacterium]
MPLRQGDRALSSGRDGDLLTSVRLETERLGLRPPVPDDADAVAELLADPEVMRFIGGRVVPRDDVPQVIERWLARWAANRMGPFMLERLDDGLLVGRCGILVWDPRDWRQSTLADAGEFAQPELGWALARTHWGRGYATEAARAVGNWARTDRRVGSLVSIIAPENIASSRVAERLGARPGETVHLPDAGDAVVWRHADELG